MVRARVLLLKVIAGEQPATSGTVTRSGDVTVGYLPQQMKVADTTSLVEETAGAFIEVIALERGDSRTHRGDCRAHRL